MDQMALIINSNWNNKSINMGKNIFEKIAVLINGKEKKKDESQVQSISKSTNAIQFVDEVMQAVGDSMKKNFGGQKMDLKDKVLVLWVIDSMQFTLLNTDAFREDLGITLYNQQGLVFKDFDIKQISGEPDKGLSEIAEGLYIELRGNVVQEVKPDAKMQRARVSSIQGHGSTVDACYILDAKVLSKCNCNIGIGRTPMLDSGLMRVNHIVVDDNENSPEFQKNKFVSRSHAHINYSEKYGFRLYVDNGGTSKAGKRTYIQRGENIIKLENPMIPEPLRDGDIIILSKNVYLMFNKENS